MSWAAVGGAVAATVVGHALADDGGGGNVTTQTQQTSANPFAVGGGLFGAQFGPNVTPGLMQAITNRELGLPPPGFAQNFNTSGVFNNQGGEFLQHTQGAPITGDGLLTPVGASTEAAPIDAATREAIRKMANEQVKTGTKEVRTRKVGAGPASRYGSLNRLIISPEEIRQQYNFSNEDVFGKRGITRNDIRGFGITDDLQVEELFGEFGGFGAVNDFTSGGGGAGGGNVGRGSNAGGFALDLAITDPQLLEAQNLGLFGGNAALQAALDSPTAALAGDLGLQFMNQVGSTNPMDIAQSQFDLLNPILQQQQQEDFLGQEARLRSQGRLGSTGSLSGQAQQNALFDAQNDAERQLLFDSLGQGLATQAQNASLGAMFSQLDPTIRGQFQGLGTNFLNIPLTLQDAMLRQAQVGGGLAGATNTGNLTQPGFNAQQAIGAGLLNSGIQGLTGSLSTAFNQPSSTLINRPIAQPGQFDSGPFPGTVGR